MMLPSINMMSAAADSTAVKSDELQRSTTSISDTTPTDIEGTPSDTIPALSKRELRRQRVANRNLHYNILGGPSYTPDFGLLVGGSALMTFRMNPSDTTQRRSVVPMAIGTTERRWVVSLGFIRNVIKALPPTNTPKSGV